MKIIIINGSPRKNGSTAFILNEIFKELNKYSDTDVKLIHAADLSLKYCMGCGACYKTGECIYKDDAESLSLEIAEADGIVIGSPTYACNVSAQIKTIIDRGHFVMEQRLYGKYAVCVTTYENYGGRDSARILKRLFSYSGAKICKTITSRNKNRSNKPESNKNIEKAAKTFYYSIKSRRKYIFQSIKHFIIFKIGIKPFIIKNAKRYEGVINHWENRHII